MGVKSLPVCLPAGSSPAWPDDLSKFQSTCPPCLWPRVLKIHLSKRGKRPRTVRLIHTSLIPCERIIKERAGELCCTHPPAAATAVAAQIERRTANCVWKGREKCEGVSAYAWIPVEEGGGGEGSSRTNRAVKDGQKNKKRGWIDRTIRSLELLQPTSWQHAHKIKKEMETLKKHV